jgi:hypothetical protein
MTESKLLKDFKAARRSGVPLLAIQTADPMSTLTAILALTEDKNNTKNFGAPLISWDIISGMKAWNETGNQALKQCFKKDEDPAMMANPAEAFTRALQFPRNTIFVVMNGHRFIGVTDTSEAAVGQALWNCRDDYKSKFCTVVILCPGIQLPPELKQDFLVLDEPLPENEEIEVIRKEVFEGNKIKEPKEEVRIKIVETLKGLSAFAIEQRLAMAITKDGVDLEMLWEGKRQSVEQTPGLTIYRGKETFEDVRGVAIAKKFLQRLLEGRDAPNVLVFMDEIEKMFAGIAGDLSGTSQEQHGEFLRWTQDNGVLALMMVGHPGCTKSFLSKACAGQFKLPMIELNMTALKGSLVGQTGLQTRNALKTISAIGRPLILATSNSLQVLPPELKRRFQLGTWFFDLPTEEESDSVWALYEKKFEIKSERPLTENWTPAEIKTCCELAWRLKCSLLEAADYIVPIIKSSPEKIKELRKAADGRFNSASNPGVYKFDEAFSGIKKPIRSIDITGVGRA